jgi:hypothetical protein
VGCLAEENKSAELRRKEKRLVRFIVVFFIVGIIVSMGALIYYVTSLRSIIGEPILDPNERIESIQNNIDTLRILLIVGSSFVTTAFILALWWAYLRYKQSTPLYSVREPR